MAVEGLSQSSYYKWRCLIALANVDAKLDPDEIKFFREQLKLLEGEGITQEQMEQLVSDLKNPMQPEVFFARVDDIFDKIDLVRMAYHLFNSDGEFEAREQQVYEYLLEQVSDKSDLSKEELDKLAKMEDDKLSVSIKPFVEKVMAMIKAQRSTTN